MVAEFTDTQHAVRSLKEEVREDLRAVLGLEGFTDPRPEQVEQLRRSITTRIEAHNRRATTLGQPPLADGEGITRRILDDLLGLGPLQTLLDNPTIEEIVVNGPYRIFVVEEGRTHLTDICFDDEEELLQLVRRTIARVGRRLDEASPMVDARLPDGSRLNAVIPPLTSRWTHVTIRKFLLRARTLEDLINLQTITREAAAFLEGAVQAGLNILISGGTGSGKTTCLNALGASISGTERAITIEETSELQLERMLPNCVALQARLPNVEGMGAVSIRSLVKNALRMRPRRLIVGEVRGGEALDMLGAMNSGHDGSMCTLHANGPRQALSKLRMYATMGEEDLPSSAITEMIAETIDLVVHLQMDPDSGRRLVSSIYEVTGLEDGVVTGSEIFSWDEQGLAWSGIRPRCSARVPAGPFPWDR